MSRLFQLVSAVGLIALAPAPWLTASPITYFVNIDTSVINGTPGFLDFDFAPGNDSQSATATITDFSTTGSLLGAPQVNGGVSGDLPGTLSIDNSTQFNDYFQEFNYGTNISFLLSFNGPALSSPDGTSTSGSTFAFAMFDSTGSNPLLTTDPNGNTFTTEVNLDGTTNALTFPAVIGGIPAATLTPTTSPVPEPSFLAALGFGLFFVVREVQQRVGARGQ
jgi:hypothetical protein